MRHTSVVAETSAEWTTDPASDTGNPGEFKQKEVCYRYIHEDDPLDEAQFAAWASQPIALTAFEQFELLGEGTDDRNVQNRGAAVRAMQWCRRATECATRHTQV